MKTAEAIEAMTDAGEFEILATRVLRIEDEDCRFIEHMGVNASGKTIAKLLDSFCLVPGSNPARFVMAAFTTAKAESLERKWLFDHSSAPNVKKATAADDGDLVKAARRAEALRKDHSSASFIVHLCTNRRVDDVLMGKVYKRAGELGLEVSLLAQSRIRDCLDTKPEGQWLRKEHLRIEAELLSLPLLLNLSKNSLERYGREFPFTPPQSFVPTSVQRKLQEAVQSARQSVYVVSGASGSGKSVASYQVLRDHVLNGGIGLWLRGEVVIGASSLEDAIRDALRSLHPTIEPDAGSIALGLATPQRRLLLVVDDVNRGQNPTATLRKILAWGKPVGSSSQEEDARSPHTVIVPVWDTFWATLDPLFRSTSWLSRHPVESMNEDDALRCLQAAMGADVNAFAKADRRQLVATLAYDPILIAMFAALPKGESVNSALATAHDAMERFVSSTQADAAAGGNHLKQEYDAALQHLAQCMLLNRDLYPRWTDVAKWLPDEQLRAVRELVRLESICRITGAGGEWRFEFRHDRILEHYLVRVLGPMLAQPEKYADVVSDPFYASFVGHALASDRHTDADVDWIRAHTPLALVAAIRFLRPGGKATQKIVSAATDWLSSAARDRRTPPVLLYRAYRLLEQADSPFVLDITKSLSTHPLLARARLANGDAAAGAIEFTKAGWFAPSVNDPRLDAVLDRAFHRHRRVLVNGCRELLEKPSLTDDTRRGALTLAGFIGDPELSHAIEAAWNSSPNRHSVLIQALWAGFGCGAGRSAALLAPMMREWAALADETPDRSLSDRAAVAEELRFAMRRYIPEDVLRYLIESAKSNEPLQWPITYLLQHVNHPVVVRFLVEQAADIERQVEESNGFSPWVIGLREQWDPTKPTRGRRLPPPALETIRLCWASEEAGESLKKTAFRFWVEATDDLSVLRAVPPTQAGFHHVLWRRAILGDLTTVPLIKPLLAVKRHWFYVIHHIWSEEFRLATDEALLELRPHTPTDYSGGRTNDHYMLAHLLRDIPIGVAEPLLLKHWTHLQYSPLFVQAALCLGTEECRALAAEAIQKYPPSADALKHVCMFFGFFRHGLSDRLTYRHLNVLLPYLGRIEDLAIMEMAEFCERHGHKEWGEAHLRTEVERRRAREVGTTNDFIHRLGRGHFPSDVDLLEDLVRIEQQGDRYEGHAGFWCEGFVRRQDDHSRWRRILQEWLARSPTIARLRIVAEAVLEHGRRGDLDILTTQHVAGDQDEILRITENARLGVMQRVLT